jgi:hypothetical protein
LVFRHFYNKCLEIILEFWNFVCIFGGIFGNISKLFWIFYESNFLFLKKNWDFLLSIQPTVTSVENLSTNCVDIKCCFYRWRNSETTSLPILWPEKQFSLPLTHPLALRKSLTRHLFNGKWNNCWFVSTLCFCHCFIPR